jgi:putative FmdB family regulatory protein
MPLYEYQCDACTHRFEVIQKFSDAPVEVCPQCGGAVRKLLSSPAIQFKGTGWYITDYARSGKTDAKGEGKADGTTDGKADAAPDKGDKGGKGDKGTDASTTSTETKSAGPSDGKPQASSSKAKAGA